MGRSILRLVEPTVGKITFRSKKLATLGEWYKEVDVTSASPKMMKSLRREMQIIFQNPYASLDPRMNVESIAGEPLMLHGIGRRVERKERICRLLSSVGLKVII